MDWFDELRQLLRPAGGGVYAVSTGLSAQAAMQRKLYGAEDQEQVRARFHAQLRALPEARGFLLGIPSDVGAGLVRGANMGPQVIRASLVDGVEDYRAWAASLGLVDLGDVF